MPQNPLVISCRGLCHAVLALAHSLHRRSFTVQGCGCRLGVVVADPFTAPCPPTCYAQGDMAAWVAGIRGGVKSMPLPTVTLTKNVRVPDIFRTLPCGYISPNIFNFILDFLPHKCILVYRT